MMKMCLLSSKCLTATNRKGCEENMWSSEIES